MAGIGSFQYYAPRPPPPGLTPDGVALWLERELATLAQSLSEQSTVELRPIYAAPDKPRTGMIVYADGAVWNPGGGAGVYTYNGAGWTLLGGAALGDVVGPAGATDDAPVVFDGVTGKLIKEKSYVAFGVLLGLALKANLASPAFTGIPTAPTAAEGNNSTQIATTEYVDRAIDSEAVVTAALLEAGLDSLTDDEEFAAITDAWFGNPVASETPWTPVVVNPSPWNKIFT